MRLKGLEVLIIGGGVAGLAAASALQARGANVTLLEQAAAFHEHGAGLQISPNGARVVAALGQGQALEAASLRARAVQLRKAVSGRRVLDMALPQQGAGFHLIHRADLVSVLQQAAADVPVRFVSRVVGVDADHRRPSVTLEGGARLSADLVIGADGLHSVARKVVQPGPEQPFFTGQVAWRALIASEQSDPVAQVFMGPGRHLVSYPLRGGRLRNIVAVEERRDWVAEGWNHPDDPDNLRAAFKGFCPLVQDWLAQVDQAYLWGLLRHEVAQYWYKGHVAILGDAAHPTLPFMAQGANMALEDAWVLAQSLEQGAGIAAGLAAYQQARRARVMRVIAAANANARNYHLRPPLAAVAHAALRVASRIQPNGALRRFGWIYDHDVTAS